MSAAATQPNYGQGTSRRPRSLARNQPVAPVIIDSVGIIKSVRGTGRTLFSESWSSIRLDHHFAVMQAALIDAHDPEVLAWHAAAGTGISGSMVRNLMLEAVELRRPVDCYSTQKTHCTDHTKHRPTSKQLRLQPRNYLLRSRRSVVS
jgi:hypothetical protein